MAGANKEEFTPLLEPGFHAMELGAIRRLCVLRFADSFTRLSIMANLEELIGQINRTAISGEIWLDGSFLTEKLNPDDADIAFVVSAQTLLNMSFEQRVFFDWFQKEHLYDRYKLDNYGLVLDRADARGEWLYAYWVRQFGFSRQNQMKGIASLSVPFLVSQ